MWNRWIMKVAPIPFLDNVTLTICCPCHDAQTTSTKEAL
jgi:hypothetical protein